VPERDLGRQPRDPRALGDARPGDPEVLIDHHDLLARESQLERTLNQARKQGYVNTMYGRKRFFPDMAGLPYSERQALERESINMPIQGSNADLIKIAMLNIHDAIAQQHLRTRMILQVHDELVFEVPDDELDTARKLVRREMEDVVKLLVPIKVEMKVGRNWYEAEPAE